MPDSGTIDLHAHSTASDGSLTPCELVAAAREAGLDALALTDHDTVAGIRDFLAAAAEAPALRAVPGVEISTRLHATPIHMLGLFIDPANGTLLAHLRQIRAARRMRNRRMLKLLAAQGIVIHAEALAERAGGSLICRSHIAHEIVAQGHCKEPQQAFERWIGRGRPAFSSIELLTVNHAIDAIHAAGGLAIWAHPTGLNKRARGKVLRMTEQLKRLGLDGIEAYYAHHNEQQIEHALHIARQCDLLVSGGSDYHGLHTPDISLGTGRGNLRIPLSIYETLRQAATRP